jgi:hypothetical protein
VVPQTPEWQKLKSLVGQWEGNMDEGGQQMPATVEVRMTGDGSAIMHIMGKDGPYEMVTMIHPDGKRVLATHYCAAHNQPRMAMVPAKAPNQIAFQFVDGTNIGPGEGYMKRGPTRLAPGPPCSSSRGRSRQAAERPCGRRAGPAGEKQKSLPE